MLFICSDKQVKLNNLAWETHVSMAEIERKANDSLQFKAVEEERELEMLAEAVIESNKKAMQSLKEAHKTVQNT